MPANLAWLDDPEVFRINQLPAHSDHYYYHDADEMATATSRYQYSLNGAWAFKFSSQPAQRPLNFEQPTTDLTDFDTITVPGHIELAGYGQIQYTNTFYPWDGAQYRRPHIRFMMKSRPAFSVTLPIIQSGHTSKNLLYQLALTTSGSVFSSKVSKLPFMSG